MIRGLGFIMIVKNEKYINKNNLIILTMIETAKMSTRGQIVIPERIRKHLKMKEGDNLIVRETDKRIIIQKEGDFMKTTIIQEIPKESMESFLLSHKSLAKDWLTKEEDEAWKHL